MENPCKVFCTYFIPSVIYYKESDAYKKHYEK